MARPHNRKRQHADDGAQDEHLSKKIKSRGYHCSSNFSPEFWDNLSKVWLTPRALLELDRRNSIRPATKPTTSEDIYSKDLARFARHGGPDLQHLRGCPKPRLNTMASNRSSRSSRSSRNTQTTNATSISSKARRSSAYDDDFEQHLIDYSIYLEGYEHPEDRGTLEPGNLGQIRQGLLATRASLSPSRVPDSVFRDFRQKNRTKSEGTVMRNVIPLIAGSADILNEGHLPFTNLEPLTNETTVKPVPDYFDGARMNDVHTQVRHDLNKTIIPTKHADVPVAPNFFLEAKAPRGGADVALRQAGYDGAYGAHAMHSLQNYGKEEPVYDNNAYTFSSTYHAGTGTLQLYAHHPTAPNTPERRPAYHMTQLKAYALTSDQETFINGATAFRNARDMAKQHRDSFIDAANTRARHANIPIGQDDINDTIEIEHNSGSTSGIVVNDPGHIPQDAHDELQRDILDQSIDEDLSDSLTSFATSFSTDQTSFKRPRQSHSPQSSSIEGHSSKSRSRPSTRRQPDADESHWVETYRRKGKLYFKNLHKQEIETKSKDWNEQALSDGTRCFSWQSTKSGRVFWTTELA
ncbi:hypothetical protein F5Y19DRAFT_221473 [Xylariaceae sp. FL1651]|nr:hypothetical protein F5Y19DRAFT_221473 [Xylariaceae sp. FL1651]